MRKNILNMTLIMVTIIYLVTNIAVPTAMAETVSAVETEAEPNVAIVSDLLHSRSWILDTITEDDLSTNPYVHYLEQYTGNTQFSDENYVALNKRITDWIEPNLFVRSLLEIYNVFKNYPDMIDDAVQEEIEEKAQEIANRIGAEQKAELIEDLHKNMFETRYEAALSGIIKTNYNSKALGYSLDSEESVIADLKKHMSMRKDFKTVASIAKKTMSNIDTLIGENNKEALRNIIDEDLYEKYYDTISSTESVAARKHFQDIFLPQLELDAEKYLNDFSKQYDSTLSPRARQLAVAEFNADIYKMAGYDDLTIDGDFIDEWYMRMQRKQKSEKIKNTFGEAANGIITAISKFDALLDTIEDINTMADTSQDMVNTFSRLKPYGNESMNNIIDSYSRIIERYEPDNIVSTYDVIQTANKNGLIKPNIYGKVKKGFSKEIKKYIASNTTINTQNIIAKAQQASIAVRAGAVLGTTIDDTFLNTGSVVDKLIEYQYTDKVLDCAYAAYQADLDAFTSVRTDENAEKVIQDLQLIKKIKLRQIDIIEGYHKFLVQHKDLFNSGLNINLSRVLANIPNLMEDRAFVDEEDVEAYCNNYRDALLAASLFNTEYTSTTDITLKNGEQYSTSFGYNKIGRLSGGLNCSGNNTIYLATNDSVYIPYIIVSGDTNITVQQGSLSIGVLAVEKGNVHLNGNADVTNISIPSSYTFTTSNELTVSGTAEISGTFSGTLIACGDTVGSGTIENLNIAGNDVQELNGNLKVTNLTFTNKGTATQIGTITVSGNVENQSSTVVDGENTILKSTGSITGNYYNSGITFEGIDINKKLTINGNVNIKGNVNINEGDLHIKGNLNQAIVSLNVGSGKLKVDGDYKINGSFNAGSGQTEVNGNFVKSFGNYYKKNFYMQDENAYVLVNGNFDFNAYGNSSTITAGTLELKGDFIQDGYGDAFPAKGTHKTILSGTGKQIVNFKQLSSSYFNILEIKNQSGLLDFQSQVRFSKMTGDLYCANDINIVGTTYTGKEIKGKSLTVNIINCPEDLNIDIPDSLTVAGGTFNLADNDFTGAFNVTGGTLNMNSGNITATNDEVKIAGNVNINEGDLHIKGNLNQAIVSLNVGSGKLKVDGDYKINGSFNAGSGQTEVNGNFVKSFGNYYKKNFYMQDENAYVLVNGNFDFNAYGNSNTITAGTLELKGNFTQAGNSSSFPAKGTHKTILSGTGEQIVTFQSPNYSHFNILENNNVSGTRFMSWNEYQEYLAEEAKRKEHELIIESCNATDGNISVSVSANSNLSEPQTGTVIIALYDNEILLGYYFEEVSVNADQNQSVEYIFDKPESNNLIIRAFWWNDLENINPLCEPVFSIIK